MLGILLRNRFQKISARLSDDRCDFRGEFTRWISGCSHCGSFLPPIDLFCPRCRRKLMSLADPQESGERASGFKFPVRTIFLWDLSSDEMVRALLHAFKGGPSLRLARELMLVISEGKRGLNPVFIPAPSSKKDHAYLLAKEAGKLWNAPVLDAFLPSQDPRKQREKTREERRARRFRLKDDMFALIGEFELEGRTVVFIDDVITTGATVDAAYMALGKPSRFEAWSLARRPRLATPDGF